MLTPKELREKSALWGVPVETVDKDWVLGHVLRGIFSHELKEKLVFKGGTCLRKAYFSDYRFSEDLDFTAAEPLTDSMFRQSLTRSLEPIYEETGIHFGAPAVQRQLFEDRLMGYRISLPFWGAAHPRHRQIPDQHRWMTRIRIDVSLHEEICLPVARRPLLHSYSDCAAAGNEIPVYCLEEIFAEKLRSLIQRSYIAPRDCYDLWYLWSHCQDRINWRVVPATFEKKCRTKGIDFRDRSVFFPPERMFHMKKQWVPSLGSHLKTIPPADIAIEDLRKAIAHLFK
ncbi:MAG: nucleotidyl transferase AbiEii/AbiGii toxin family protein [Deltaproteobacteria bacterium]|nr:MAG: nucleotidyl transferase AbiEii/AbiGii toxin family protein [Deltaproteobacteria bacterium]